MCPRLSRVEREILSPEKFDDGFPRRNKRRDAGENAVIDIKDIDFTSKLLLPSRVQKTAILRHLDGREVV